MISLPLKRDVLLQCVSSLLFTFGLRSTVVSLKNLHTFSRLPLSLFTIRPPLTVSMGSVEPSPLFAGLFSLGRPLYLPYLPIVAGCSSFVLFLSPKRDFHTSCVECLVPCLQSLSVANSSRHSHSTAASDLLLTLPSPHLSRSPLPPSPSAPPLPSSPPFFLSGWLSLYLSILTCPSVSSRADLLSSYYPPVEPNNSSEDILPFLYTFFLFPLFCLSFFCLMAREVAKTKPFFQLRLHPFSSKTVVVVVGGG